MTESFNSMLREHRAKTYLCLLEHIRRIVMKRFQERKEQCARWNCELSPIVNAKIIKVSIKSRLLKMLSAGNGEYELLGETRAYAAKLNLHSCECGVWQVSGVPCSHALAGISHYMQFSTLNDVVADFVHPSLTKTTFLRTYESMIHPVPDLCMWPIISTTPVIPPPIKTLPGKPRVAKRREADERPKGTRVTSVVCRKCGLVGHNKRTCKGGTMSKVRELFYFVCFAPFCMFYL
ncbi:hypothetical protein ACOSQ2_017415 [Xanthoceras sorbifolium]